LPTGCTDAMGAINNVIAFVGVITALSRFIFTYEGVLQGSLGWVSKIGRWMILLALGASFGYTVMTRFGM
jgi:hypothetical protein